MIMSMPLNMNSWLSSINSWFAAAKSMCPICGRSATGAASAVAIPIKHPKPRQVIASLCSSCRQEIPWITYPICRICGRAERCEDCIRRQMRHFSISRCAVRYDDRMKEWLAQYKYRGNEQLEPVLAAMLAFAYERLQELAPSPSRSQTNAPPQQHLEFQTNQRTPQHLEFQTNASTPQRLGRQAPATQPPRIQTITSVPLAPERLLDRGFNQAERLAMQLAGWYGLSYRPLLHRLRHTEKQSLKTRRSRVTDMKGNFAAAPIALFSDTIILVDDIYTTGSTLDECARVLQQADSSEKPAEIYGLLWARS